MADRREPARRGGGGGFSNSRGNDASSARYAGQARAAAEAAARARAIAAGRNNAPGALAGTAGAAEPVYDDGGFAGGGGDVGGGAAPAPAPLVNRPDLNGYLEGSYLVKAAREEAERGLIDYDAETERGTGSVKADQATRYGMLQKQLDGAGVGNAEDMAGRGLLRSGLTFQNQDKINAEGVQQRNVIGDLLTDFLSDRTSGRVSTEAKLRQQQNDARQREIDNYIKLYGAV